MHETSTLTDGGTANRGENPGRSELLPQASLDSGARLRVLDSHLHIWDPATLDYPTLERAGEPLNRRFATRELREAVGVVEAERAFVPVLVEQMYLEEVAWIAALAEEMGVVGIVAAARLDRGLETIDYLDVLAHQPLVVGIRHLLQDEVEGLAGTTAFRAGAAVLAGLDMTFDACVRSEAQLREVVALAAAVPQLRMVLDHLGKPKVGTAASPLPPSAGWVEAMTALGAHEQVYCKLSGFPPEAGGDWSPAQAEPYFDVALAAFGPERLLIGSDWPVSAVTAGGAEDGGEGAAIDPAFISTWTNTVVSWAETRRLDVDAILWRNAARFYRIA